MVVVSLDSLSRRLVDCFQRLQPSTSGGNDPVRTGGPDEAFGFDPVEETEKLLVAVMLPVLRRHSSI